MGFLKKLIGIKNPTNTDVFSKYAARSLKFLDMPLSDANILKMTVYLCFAQLACMIIIARGAADVFMDKMVEDARNSILHLSMRVKDLAKDKIELNRILGDFPIEAGVTGETTVNGLAAWEAVYLTYVEEVVSDMASRTNGPMAPYGYPTIKIQEAFQVKNSGGEKFLEHVQMLSEMTGDVIKAFR